MHGRYVDLDLLYCLRSQGRSFPPDCLIPGMSLLIFAIVLWYTYGTTFGCHHEHFVDHKTGTTT